MDNFNAIIAGAMAEEYLVQDGWTEIFHVLFVGWRPDNDEALKPEEAQRLAELADLRKGEQMRAWVDAHVDRPDVAEGLKPWYGALCKRPAFNDEYLPTFNRDNARGARAKTELVKRRRSRFRNCRAGIEWTVRAHEELQEW